MRDYLQICYGLHANGITPDLSQERNVKVILHSIVCSKRLYNAYIEKWLNPNLIMFVETNQRQNNLNKIKSLTKQKRKNNNNKRITWRGPYDLPHCTVPVGSVSSRLLLILHLILPYVPFQCEVFLMLHLWDLQLLIITIRQYPTVD